MRVAVIGVMLCFVGACSNNSDASAKKATNPHVRLETNKGAITIELLPKQAPKTVENFLSYIKDGSYSGTIFHRVIDGFMIQGGGFDETMNKKPTKPPVVNESTNGLKNLRGTIAMARTSDPDSATNQFFINVVDNPRLDAGTTQPNAPGYTVFGKVADGMKVVDAIRAVPTICSTKAPGPCDIQKTKGMRDVPATPVTILSASLVEG